MINPGIRPLINKKWKLSVFILCLFFQFIGSNNLFAQEITGVWKGSIYNDSTKTTLPLEIIISGNIDFYRGYAYVVYTDSGREASYLKKVKVNYRKGNIAFEEIITVIDSTPSNKKSADLTYAAAFSNITKMDGIWKTEKKKELQFYTGTLKLQKENNFEETEIYKKLQALGLTKDLTFNKKEPEPEYLDLAALPKTKIEKLSDGSSTLKQKPVIVAYAKKTPPVIIKAPVFIDEPKTDVAVVEKKPVPPPVIEKKAEPIVKKDPPPTVAIKTVPPPVTVKPVVVEKKITPPPTPVAVVKPPVEKKVVPPPVAAKPPIEKKVTTPVKKEVAVAVKPPVKTPPPVAVAETKKEPVVPKPVPAISTVLPSTNTGAAEVTNRTISSIQTVEYQSDSLVLTLYDNGEVDGDTVSVLMNGAVIFSKVGLTTKPNRKTIHIDKDTPDSLTMVMYAENLGSYPPNTGLLVVWDGDLVYEVRFSADLKSNAAIIFRRKRLQ